MPRIISKLLLFLPILLVVAIINYTVDPSQLFGNGRVEREVAEIMLRGENVSNLENFDHRLLQKYYLEGLEHPKDIVVIGSSRSMLLSSSLFTGSTLYNASTAGSSIEDYIAIYDILARNHVMPRTVVLEISPWLFNANNNQTRWKSLNSEYADGLDLLSIEDTRPSWATLDFEKYSGLFSFSYLQESLRWLGRPVEFYATTQMQTGTSMKLSDGSRVYSDVTENLSPDELANIVQQSLTEPYGFDNYTETDDSIFAKFVALVSYLQNQGVRVVFFLAPYHPDYYSTLVNDSRFQIIEQVENQLDQLASEKQIDVWGTYDPVLVGCSASQYYDGLHAKLSCLQKIMPAQ